MCGFGWLRRSGPAAWACLTGYTGGNGPRAHDEQAARANQKKSWAAGSKRDRPSGLNRERENFLCYFIFKTKSNSNRVSNVLFTQIKMRNFGKFSKNKFLQLLNSFTVTEPTKS